MDIHAQMHASFHVKWSLKLSNINNWTTQYFVKFSNIKFNENLSDGSGVVSDVSADWANLISTVHGLQGTFCIILVSFLLCLFILKIKVHSLYEPGKVLCNHLNLLLVYECQKYAENKI
jgi:glucan phosphoethanolaminetransferase (alkaline phosphatase superfamily)